MGTRLLAVALYAFAMAYFESAAVVYLRAVYGIEDLLRDLPLVPDLYTRIELGREVATLVMLAMIGWIAGRRWQDKVGYAIFAFGLWDIFYYVCMVIFIGWPKMLLEWDLLFLIPLPWWGPVLSPILVALILAAGGGAIVLKTGRGEMVRLTIAEWSVAVASTLLVLYTFMFDALRALPGGIRAVIRARPTSFNWPLFVIALVGIAFSLLKALRSKPCLMNTQPKANHRNQPESKMVCSVREVIDADGWQNRPS